MNDAKLDVVSEMIVRCYQRIILICIQRMLQQGAAASCTNEHENQNDTQVY